MIDIAHVRADTPGCRDVVHLNNAGAALPPRVVVDTVIDHLQFEARVGGYAAADAVAERSTAVYTSIASLTRYTADAARQNATNATATSNSTTFSKIRFAANGAASTRTFLTHCFGRAVRIRPLIAFPLRAGASAFG